ncbi:hypothetical protein B0H14DRAFT_2603352 [Mycena olivaceomarginata]|nr:hypothetical protein B0H14DRAFT_2603352 [Mycena olivaceomarginata]
MTAVLEASIVCFELSYKLCIRETLPDNFQVENRQMKSLNEPERVHQGWGSTPITIMLLHDRTECGRPKGAARSSACVWASTTTAVDAAGVSRAFMEVSDHIPAAVMVEPEPDAVRLPWAKEETTREAPMPEGLRMVTVETGGPTGHAATGNGCADLE